MSRTISEVSFALSPAPNQPTLSNLQIWVTTWQTKLFMFASAWNDQAKFPTTLRPLCSSLLEKVASKASDLDIWTAVAQLLVAFDSPRVTPRSKESNGKR